jgi:hypothetical protein
MTRYRVQWDIDIDADSPKQAAEEALKIHRDHNSIATVFNVREWGTLDLRKIDLQSGTEESI